MRMVHSAYIKKIDYYIFGAKVHICITEHPNEFLDKSGLRLWYGGETPDEDAEKDSGGFMFQKGKKDYYIVIPPEAGLMVVVHESDHAINRLFADRGVLADYRNDEIHAYYLGELAATVEKFRAQVLEELTK